uniref:Uncharacterized protein n=1 Tax=Anguilla anguilla TaxID=7936 RepID=A0A0E9XAS3_ANGAN
MCMYEVGSFIYTVYYVYFYRTYILIGNDVQLFLKNTR